ncbi:tetratricopeptide repeat protein [Sandaracinobacteroides hominis]|uniref:tetratricopeptide repeat protein n=1 Tax=Sandaracinobacteroides hominis TaxID=2780086 RepID=UPI0018F6D715|nr:tetratricopeptide repeat protein [Sandaracinobacteroides hominis]
MKSTPIIAAAAVLGLAAAGYAVTGSPGLKSAPAPARSLNPDLTPEAEQASKQLLENFGDVRAWLTLSDALIRIDRTETAVEALQSGLEAIPGNADLWVQLGIALVAHADGEVVPAARLAFDRASRLAPEHPAPAYFLGLAWLQSGDVQQALQTWKALRDRSPADAEWVPMLDRQIAVAENMAQMGVGQGIGSGVAGAEPQRGAQVDDSGSPSQQ